MVHEIVDMTLDLLVWSLEYVVSCSDIPKATHLLRTYL